MRAMVVVVLLLLITLPAVAKGPVGVGDLKIGMSRSQVEGLAESASVHLVGALKPYEYRNSKPTPGEDVFTGQLMTPFWEKPLEATLTFEKDALIRFSIQLGESNYIAEDVRRQIASKYGEPKVEDTFKEEQCIYKNGANFKVKSGAITYSWTDTAKDRPIATSVIEAVFDSCPSNLRYGTDALKFNSLGIGYQKPKAPDTSNPF